MTVLGSHFELDDLGGDKFRHTQHMKAIAYRDGGTFKRINSDWQQGDAQRPHIITAAPFMVSVASDSHRRIHPTREIDRYFEIGAPYIKPAGNWQKVNLGNAARKGNSITWSTANADLRLIFGGHFIKLEIPLKNGWQPPGGQFAFPVGLTGLTRNGGQILADGKPVMQVRASTVHDEANPEDVRPIAHDFVQVAGQWYALFTLPSLAGMSRPVIDPTLTLQPDATDGIDTRILSLDPYTTYNYGVNDSIAIGEYNAGVLIERTLIKFNLTNLPNNAIISSSILSLYCRTDYSDNADIFRVFRLKRSWVEGTRNGTADTPATGATWNRYDLTNSWQTAGGFGTDDCEQTDIGSRSFTSTETLNEFKDFSLTPTTKAALDLGNGWMMKGDTELNDLYIFSSSDHTAAYRPKLVVEYTLPGGGARRMFIPDLGFLQVRGA